MKSSELTDTHNSLINAAFELHVHLKSCTRYTDCQKCRELINAKNSIQKKYEAMAYGQPSRPDDDLPPLTPAPMHNKPPAQEDDLPMMLRKQAD